MTAGIDTYSWGPSWISDDRIRFRLWAPDHETVSLRSERGDVTMRSLDAGWFDIETTGLAAGEAYVFVLPDGAVVPDPASRRQTGVSGPSTLVDPNRYQWKCAHWKGRPWEEAIIYELHVGTFTPEGTFLAAIEHLRYLADIGFTAIELMPIGQFPGERGWGYDGVFAYAPHQAYGHSDDLKALIDAAHRYGLMVILDVVYNHFGPEGNFVPNYAKDFFSDGEPTPWGPRIAFQRSAVRSFFVENALYWLHEFRLDGLRLDAVDQIEDDSDKHILEEISTTVRAAFPERIIHLVTENAPNGTDLMATRENGDRLYLADWNDDFHHALHAAVTGEHTGHYAPFSTDPFGQTARALATGYLREPKRTLRSASPASSLLPPSCFVHFLQNHDQVGNRARGDRLDQLVPEDLYRVLVELLALSPQIPLFFMGDDHRSSRPFFFFADYGDDTNPQAVRDREDQAMNFGGLPPGTVIPHPSSHQTFLDSKLDWSEAGERRATE